MNYKEIGKQIKRKRIENKLRQEDLAEMADLSTGYISQVECGKKAPSLENFIIIANCLNVSADELLTSEINNGHLLRMSAYLEKMKDLSEEKQKIICDIIEVLLKN